MTRSDVVQSLIDRLEVRTYLEIGVEQGVSFMPIRVRRKIAVDPRFSITRKSRLKWLLLNLANWTAEFHQVPSDRYFEKRVGNTQIDVVLIDGLHIYEQLLKDVNNTFLIMTGCGVVVMHDCNSPHVAVVHSVGSFEAAAVLGLFGWDWVWTGDVWKTICHFRSQRFDLNAFVLDCDRGLGIVTRGTPESQLSLTSEEIREMSYEDLARDRANLLNLKPETYLDQFLADL